MEGFELVGRTVQDGIDVVKLRHNETGALYQVHAFHNDRIADYDRLCTHLNSMPREISRVVSVDRDQAAGYVMTELLPEGTGIESWIFSLASHSVGERLPGVAQPAARSVRTESASDRLFQMALEMRSRRSSPGSPPDVGIAVTGSPVDPLPPPPKVVLPAESFPDDHAVMSNPREPSSTSGGVPRGPEVQPPLKPPAPEPGIVESTPVDYTVFIRTEAAEPIPQFQPELERPAPEPSFVESIPVGASVPDDYTVFVRTETAVPHPGNESPAPSQPDPGVRHAPDATMLYEAGKPYPPVPRLADAATLLFAPEAAAGSSAGEPRQKENGDGNAPASRWTSPGLGRWLGRGKPPRPAGS